MQITLSSPFKMGLTIRTLETSDANSLTSLILENRLYLRQWLGWLDNDFTVDFTEKLILRGHERNSSGVALELGIFLHENLIGRLSLNEIGINHKKASIGYWVDSGHQGNGITTESVRLLCQYSFLTLRLIRLEIRCAIGNTKSQAVATKLKFKREDILPAAESLYGSPVDHVLFSMLTEQWDIL